MPDSPIFSEKYQAKVIRRKDDDLLVLNLKLGDNHTRIEIDYTSPSCEVYMKFDNRKGILVLNYDEDIDSDDYDDEDEDEWDSDEDQKCFVGDNRKA